MSVTLTGTGGLFTRLGRIFFGIKSANTYSGAGDISAGGLKSLGVTATNILAEYASAQQDQVNGLWTTIDSARTSLSQIKTDLARMAESTLIEQVHADAVLTEKTKAGAMAELIDQMAGAGTVYSPDDDVDAPTVSASVTADAGNTGSGTVIASVVGPDGRNREYVFAENIEVIVSTDVAAGATARAESANVRGEHAVSDTLAYNWPGGSGASTTITCTDAVLDNDRNLLTNSDFEDFTSNTPDDWTVLVGAAGTDILKETTVVYRGTNTLEFIGTGGSPLSSVAQTFADDTEGELEPNTVYAVALLMRKSASLAAGNIEIRLLDTSNAVINDDAGTANTISVAHGAIDDAAFGWHGGFFRTPKTLVPGTTVHKFNIRVSTALTSGESVYIADAAIVEATEVYPGGPFIGLFAGDDDFLVGDKFTVTIANNRAGDFQDWFERVFGMRAMGLQLPSDTGGNETVADSLVA